MPSKPGTLFARDDWPVFNVIRVVCFSLLWARSSSTRETADSKIDLFQSTAVNSHMVVAVALFTYRRRFDMLSEESSDQMLGLTSG